MKKALYILTTLTALLPLLSACSREVEENIWCEVTLTATLPDGRGISSLVIPQNVSGNVFKNLNTGINYRYPILSGGRGGLRVQKGVYMLSFDGIAELEDGSRASVRFTRWGTPYSAVNLLDDTASLTLELLVM